MFENTSWFRSCAILESFRRKKSWCAIFLMKPLGLFSGLKNSLTLMLFSGFSLYAYVGSFCNLRREATMSNWSIFSLLGFNSSDVFSSSIPMMCQPTFYSRRSCFVLRAVDSLLETSTILLLWRSSFYTTLYAGFGW